MEFDKSISYNRVKEVKEKAISIYGVDNVALIFSHGKWKLRVRTVDTLPHELDGLELEKALVV